MSDIENGVYPMSEELKLPLEKEERTTRVYVCGFIEKRLHNVALFQIANDLLTRFYVSGNPCGRYKWTHARTVDVLSDCDVFIFLINEFTLKDYTCLRTLQFAYEMDVPVIMVRNPRLRLVVTPMIEQLTNAATPIPPPVDSGRDSPNMFLLQDVVYDGYKSSIEYDKLQHEVSMRRIYKRISEVRKVQSPRYPASAKERSFLPYVPALIESFGLSKNNKLRSKDLHLPPIRQKSSNGHSNGHSTNHHVHSNGHQQQNQNAVTPARKRSQSVAATKRRSTDSLKSENTTTSEDSSTETLQLRRGSHDRYEAGFGSLEHNGEDAIIFHRTQYLVFSIHNKEHKPRLVKFPEDILALETATQEPPYMEMESIWGSETSLDLDDEFAVEKIQGNLDVPSTPNTPTPKTQPL